MKSAHSELALFALYWLVVTFPNGIVHILVMIRLRVVFGGRRVGQVLSSSQNRQISALDETADAPQSSLFSLHLSSINTYLSSPDSGPSRSARGCSLGGSPFSNGIMHILKKFAPRLRKKRSRQGGSPNSQGNDEHSGKAHSSLIVFHFLSLSLIVFHFPSFSFIFLQFLSVSFIVFSFFYFFLFFIFLGCSKKSSFFLPRLPHDFL